MLENLKRLLKRPDPLALVDPLLIDQLADLACPRIRLASRYREKLAPYLGWAEARATETVSLLPTSLPLTPESWRQHRLLQLVFATPQRMQEIINQDKRLAAWFYDWPLADQLCTLLSVDPQEQTRYGVAEQDGQLRQDVPQRLLTFREHRFGQLTDSEAGLHALLPLQILDLVAGLARSEVAALESEKAQLEEEVGNARVMLRLGNDATPQAAAARQQQQERIRSLTAELERTHAAMNPDALCELLVTQLAATPDLLSIAQRSYTANRLGLLDTGDDDEEQLLLTECTLARTPPLTRVLIPVIIPRTQVAAHNPDQGGFKPALL
ncbi:hypothetical protein [Chitinilyticum litopenaei]|uniref:hypothetical protein n=1 Tax=Chitinilyticum litopenaei TaxID=1121276 RepID=UPI0003FE3E58|nr:hypothetical protein [Chitinilyticum litopenaei]